MLRDRLIVGLEKAKEQMKEMDGDEFKRKYFPPAIHTCLYKSSIISQSDTYFLIHENNYLPFLLYIYKDSECGKSLKEWIEKEENRTNDKIAKKSIEIAIPYLLIDEIVEIMEMKESIGIEKGIKKIKYDFRKLLGL